MMEYDPRRVVEILLEELGQVLHLSPELLDRCQNQTLEPLRLRRSILCLATGEEPLDDATVESFRAVTAQGLEAALLRSHSFAQVWTAPVLRARMGNLSLLDTVAPETIRCLPERFPLLCVLRLSANTAAKTVLGLRDAVPPQVLRTFLERGRPVVAVGLPPPRVALDEQSPVFWGLPVAVRSWIGEGYRTLEQWGVEFVEAERLAETIRRRLFGGPGAPESPTKSSEGLAAGQSRQFVTADDVRAARMRGERQIIVGPHGRVTDEAREFARRWGILLLE